jgi:hypothetical protein
LIKGGKRDENAGVARPRVFGSASAAALSGEKKKKTQAVNRKPVLRKKGRKKL